MFTAVLISLWTEKILFRAWSQGIINNLWFLKLKIIKILALYGEKEKPVGK